MRLLIVDKLPDANVRKLRDIVGEVDYRPDVSADDLGEHARGIYVTNCPDKNAVAAAELTMGLLTALDRRIPDQVMDLRDGLWNK